jgi:hypothetical protein
VSRFFFCFLILFLALTPSAVDSGLFAIVIAEAYEHGWCLPRDDTAAFRWLHRAAERGTATAQRALAWDYYKGIGTNADPREALRWWIEAAKEGEPADLLIVGDSFCLGAGVNPDARQARIWWQKAADLGNADAIARLKEPGCRGLMHLIQAERPDHLY